MVSKVYMSSTIVKFRLTPIIVVAVHEMLIKSKPPAFVTITDKFVGGDGLSRYDKNSNYLCLNHK